MDADETGPPGKETGGSDTARFQKTKETTGADPTIAGVLCKQISHMLCAAERFQPRSRAWSLIQITIGIWRRRREIQRERRVS